MTVCKCLAKVSFFHSQVGHLISKTRILSPQAINQKVERMKQKQSSLKVLKVGEVDKHKGKPVWERAPDLVMCKELWF
jgi:hypothetical protein